MAELCQWEDIQKVVYTKRLLTGSVKLSVMYERCTKSWEKLRTALKTEFEETIDSYDVHRQLSRRKKKSDESNQEYIYKMLEIGSQADIEVRTVIKYIIEGIPDDPYNKAVLYRAKTIRQLKESFLQYESMKNEVKTRRRNDNQEDEKSRRKEAKTCKQIRNDVKTRRCHNCGSKDHLSAECPDKNKGPKCFKCDQFGHVASKCGSVCVVNESEDRSPRVRVDAVSSCAKTYKEATIADKKVMAIIEECEVTIDGPGCNVMQVLDTNRNEAVNEETEKTRQTRTKEDIALHKTRKPIRKLENDGVIVTTTTSKVIDEDEKNETENNDHLFKKQELQELKILQEQKQFQDLSQKEHFARVQQDKRFEQECDLKMLSRQQRQVEKAEAQQEVDLRLASEKTRVDQERDLKQFREDLKQELHHLKTEVDMMPKDRRKYEFRVGKEKLENDHEEREKIPLMERQFLQQKQQLMRAREAVVWKFEKKQFHEKYQLSKRQLKDVFFLQRHQMLIRHKKELDQSKRMNQRREEELIKREAEERRSLPKRIRAEMMAKEMMFKESMSENEFISDDDEHI